MNPRTPQSGSVEDWRHPVGTTISLPPLSSPPGSHSLRNCLALMAANLPVTVPPLHKTGPPVSTLLQSHPISTPAVPPGDDQAEQPSPAPAGPAPPHQQAHPSSPPPSPDTHTSGVVTTCVSPWHVLAGTISTDQTPSKSPRPRKQNRTTAGSSYQLGMCLCYWDSGSARKKAQTPLRMLIGLSGSAQTKGRVLHCQVSTPSPTERGLQSADLLPTALCSCATPLTIFLLPGGKIQEHMQGIQSLYGGRSPPP